MEPEFITYQKFNDPALAKVLSETLEKHRIDCLIEEDSTSFDPFFTYNSLAIEFLVKIKPADFERANQLLKEEADDDIGEADKDHYLFAFTNDELMEVITKADEWSAFDVVLARKILAEKGITISDQQISQINWDRVEELKIAESMSTTQLWICYLFAVGLGFIGIIMGVHVLTGKKTLPDGKRVYAYTENDRWHGKQFLYIGIASFITTFLYKFGVIF